MVSSWFKWEGSNFVCHIVESRTSGQGIVHFPGLAHPVGTANLLGKIFTFQFPDTDILVERTDLRLVLHVSLPDLAGLSGREHAPHRLSLVLVSLAKKRDGPLFKVRPGSRKEVAP
jgi:hypothetical protein